MMDGIIINYNNTSMDNNLNFSINCLDNKSLEKKKRNERINIPMIT